MSVEQQLVALERGFWEAAGRGSSFYREHMAEKGLAVMPDPAGVMGKADLVAWSDEPISLWTNVRIEDVRLIPLGDCVAALVYRGSAQRDGQAYTANISSVYVERDGSWQLLLHQQSPPMTQP